MTFSKSSFMAVTFFLSLSSIASAVVSNVASEEKEALTSLYKSTNGDSWTKNDNWLKGDPCNDKWHGITCKDNSIVKVILHTNNLVGSIPYAIGHLANLTYLSLGKNRLSGELPESLGKFSKLRDLRLYDNQFSGVIPQTLAYLTELKTLNLSKNNLTGDIDVLGELLNLEYLTLGDNNFKGKIPKSFGNLLKLTDLRLYKNCFQGEIPEELGGLLNLRTLNLSKNRLTGKIPASLGKLEKLTYLSLGGNKLQGKIPASLGNLVELKDLRLYTNRLSGKIPEELGKLENLVTLHLYNNRLKGKISSELGNLTSLKSLKLSKNRLKGTIPEEFYGLNHLEELFLERNKFSGEVLVAITKMDSLKCVRVYKTDLVGEDEDTRKFLKEVSRCITNIVYTPKCHEGEECDCTNDGYLDALINGSFEKFDVRVNHGSWKEANLEGWEGLIEVWTPKIGKEATEGNHKIELDLAKEVDQISQTVDTIAVPYVLSFDAYARTKNTSDIEVWIDDNKIATVTPTENWKRYEFKTFGNDATLTVKFKEVEKQNNQQGAIIDNVTFIHPKLECWKKTK